jgi:hypothetical protein
MAAARVGPAFELDDGRLIIDAEARRIRSLIECAQPSACREPLRAIEIGDREANGAEAHLGPGGAGGDRVRGPIAARGHRFRIA